MTLEHGIKVYGSFLEKCVNYVNNGWDKNYTTSDVAGIELGDTFLFVHFDKEDYTKEAYPITIKVMFKHEDF